MSWKEKTNKEKREFLFKVTHVSNIFLLIICGLSIYYKVWGSLIFTIILMFIVNHRLFKMKTKEVSGNSSQD